MHLKGLLQLQNTPYFCDFDFLEKIISPFFGTYLLYILELDSCIFIEKGCDVNYNGTIVMWNEEEGNWEPGMTSLMLALLTYSLNTAQVLLNQSNIGIEILSFSPSLSPVTSHIERWKLYQESVN